MSATFHGRDVFAPAAAWLAGGGEPQAIAHPVQDWVTIQVPAAQEQPGAAVGERVFDGTVVAVDRFGSLVTNLPAELASAHGSSVQVEIAGQRIGPLLRTYSDVLPGHPLVLIGSSNRLEIAVRDGSAAARLGAGAARGLPVRLRLRGDVA
jgi:S-adenosylmethionine hydrolase